MDDWKKRKEERTKAYWASHGKKLVKCLACNGSGWYDGTNKWGRQPKCGSCKGKGKVRET